MDINIGISENKRELITKGLSHLLADTYILYLKTHGYHWNVTGSLFQTLHLMFEDQYTELVTAIDEIAERIRTLGVYAPSSYAQFHKLSSIKEETKVPKATDMIKNLIADHETLVQVIRKVSVSAEEGNDGATLDLLTRRVQTHEKTAWILRSLLE